MSLDIKKVYIDSRFRTKNSKSESDFFVELPRAFNVPDGVVAHIDDIVIPASWSTIDERNNVCYTELTCGSNVRSSVFSFIPKNDDGYQFATALNEILMLIADGFDPHPAFTVTYDHLEHVLVIGMTDGRNKAAKDANPIKLQFLTDEMLKNGPSKLSDPTSINTIMGNTSGQIITELAPYVCYLDLFQTRNLYLCSSALASYDTVSNFGNDTIIKKNSMCRGI